MSALINILRDQLPLRLQEFDPAAHPTGLVIVDEVNGFATIGAGALAPPVADEQVARMVTETDALARRFAAAGWPVLAFLDSHTPGKPEPPYPPHCEQGSGEDELVPELAWLETSPAATLVRKDCINGFVGAMDPATGRNAVVDWVNVHGLKAVLVVGICTDICVMDFVLTLLSARNHGLMPNLAHIAVFEPGCATYDLPKDVALSLGLPETAAHPKAITHHTGLYFMASRGAMLISNVL
jgi:nicotinamidase-related amidase